MARLRMMSLLKRFVMIQQGETGKKPGRIWHKEIWRSRLTGLVISPKGNALTPQVFTISYQVFGPELHRPCKIILIPKALVAIKYLSQGQIATRLFLSFTIGFTYRLPVVYPIVYHMVYHRWFTTPLPEILGLCFYREMEGGYPVYFG